MANKPAWLIVSTVCTPLIATAPAYAVQYLTVEQAQKLMQPQAEAFVSAPLTLSPEQKRFVEKASGVRLHFVEQPIWKVMAGGRQAGWFVVDEVYGKHEFITYAVALDMTGTVRGVEILDYRETHGGEVRNPKWRAQFDGKRHGAPLRLDEGIQNISGATLSCRHIADGVKRILAMHEAALK